MADGNCDDALHELYGYLDGELTVERRITIQHHLDDCPPCYEAFDFEAELPRLPTGKLYKRLLRDRYWGNKTSRIV